MKQPKNQILVNKAAVWSTERLAKLLGNFEAIIMQIEKTTKLETIQLLDDKGFFSPKRFELKPASYQNPRHFSTKIQGRSYSGHALDQMQNRGFTPSIVEEIVKNGSCSALLHK